MELSSKKWDWVPKMEFCGEWARGMAALLVLAAANTPPSINDGCALIG